MKALNSISQVYKALIDGIPKCRSILSQIGCLTYNIAKYVLDFVSPITKNEYTLKDFLQFVCLIYKQDHNSFMCNLTYSRFSQMFH